MANPQDRKPSSLPPERVRLGISRDEVVWPEREVELHIASGSGWDVAPGERGGGKVPDRNPWREDPPFKNPAQDGVSSGEERQWLARPWRRR